MWINKSYDMDFQVCQTIKLQFTVISSKSFILLTKQLFWICCRQKEILMVGTPKIAMAQQLFCQGSR